MLSSAAAAPAACSSDARGAPIPDAMSRSLGVALALASLALAGGCRDEARDAYFAYLRSDEDGSSPERRRALIERAVELAPGNAAHLETRAVHFVDARDFERALTDLDQAIALEDRPYLRYLRGLVRCQNRQCAMALPDFDLAIAGQPENAQFHRGRALARVDQGDAEGGLADADRLLALQPSHPGALHARGVALAALGRDEEALAALDAQIALRPDLVYPVRDRAEVRMRLGDAQGAAADRERAQQLAREHEGCAPCLDPFRY
jgi:tetratricopeptide (TPR) repeat protein